jgi:hypothetical protein
VFRKIDDSLMKYAQARGRIGSIIYCRHSLFQSALQNLKGHKGQLKLDSGKEVRDFRELYKVVKEMLEDKEKTQLE